MKKIKILLVGSGNMAREHYKAFSSFNKFKFVGVVARKKKKLSHFSQNFKIPFFSTNIIKAHIKTNPDLVIIAVSELSTYELCKKLINFNSTLFVEKPLGYNFAQTKKIINLFEKNKKKAFVALNRRHYYSTRLLNLQLLKEKGKRFVVVNDQEDLIEQKKNKVPKKIINNFMYANSVHLIDYFNIFCRGYLKNIKTYNSFSKQPFFVQSILNFSSGDMGIYFAIYNKQSPWYVTVKVKNNFFILKPLEKLKSNKNIKRINLDHSDDINFKPGFKLQAKEVLNYFQGKKFNLPSYKDVYRTVSIINKIYK